MKIEHALFIELNRTEIIERGSKFIMKYPKSSTKDNTEEKYINKYCILYND